MRATPFPPHESRRLATVQRLRILDTGAEAFTDAVATSAAAIANTPISAISIVDAQRQWFKGSCNLGVRETTRDISFCAHALGGLGLPLIVPDASADDRFVGNPLVAGRPYIRFYAGFPLLVDDDAIGTLCVMDDRPRTLFPEQIERLIALAAATAVWLSRHRSRDRR